MNVVVCDCVCLTLLGLLLPCSVLVWTHEHDSSLQAKTKSCKHNFKHTKERNMLRTNNEGGGKEKMIEKQAQKNKDKRKYSDEHIDGMNSNYLSTST